jgi:hypothetical protein
VAGAPRAASTSPRPVDSRPSGHRLSARGRPAPPHLDGWLTGLFHPATLDVPLDALIAASQDASGTAEACARSSGRWPTASASSPATERRWTPEQFNFFEVWTSRSSPRRPLVRMAPTRREPLGAHHHHLPDRPAPSRHLPCATRAGAVRASSADAFTVRRTVRPCHARGPLMARRPDVRVRRSGVGAEGAHGATVKARIACAPARSSRTRSRIPCLAGTWSVSPWLAPARVERTSTAPPSDDQRKRRSSSHSGRLSPTTKGYGSRWIFEPWLTCVKVLRRVQHPAFSLGNTTCGHLPDRVHTEPANSSGRLPAASRWRDHKLSW